MASRTTKIRIATEANTAALKKTAEEVRKVQKAGNEANKAQVAMGNQGAKAGKRNAWAMGQASMQLQDVAVQAQMGTDSLRILGQQGPQLLSAFGPTGMLAGLAVAVGAGLVSAFRKPKEEIGDLMEEMEAFAEQAEKMAKLRFQEMEDSLESTIKRAKDAAAAFNEMSNAQATSDDRALEAADAMIEAELTLKKLRGEDTTIEEAKLKNLQEQRKIEEDSAKAKTELSNQRGLEIEQVKEINAQQEILNEKIRAQRALIAGTEEGKDPLFEEYEKRQAKMGTRVYTLGLMKGHTPSKGQEKRTQEAFDLITEANEKLDEQRTALKGMLKEQGDTALALSQAERKLAQTNETIAGDLEQIDMASQAISIKASGDALSKQLDIVEKSIAEATAAVGAGAPEDVMARLATLLKDGIQTQELEEVTRLLEQMGIKINEGYGKQNKTLKTVIGELERLQTQADMNERQLQMIQSRSKTAIPR